MKLTRTALALAFVMAPLASAAAADDPETSTSTTATEGRTIWGQHGAAVTAGVGVDGFSNDDANNNIDTGFTYTARLRLGTQQPLGFELAYFGGVQDVDALGLDSSAFLVSNGVEGDMRLAFGRSNLKPYALTGIAWRHYTLAGEDFNTSAVNGSDNVLEIPVAAGLTWTLGKFLVDGRLAYRFAAGEDLLGGVNGGGAGLNNWDATVQAGLEF